MSHMFYFAESFNQPVNFDTKNVTDMSEMFSYAESFNQPVNFDTKNVTDMREMFAGAEAFLRDKKTACDFYINADKNMAFKLHGTLSETSIFGVVIGCK